MKLNWKQIVLGVLAYIGLMILFMIVLVIGFFVREAMAGRSLENLDDRVFLTTPMLIWILIFDFSALLIGASVAAARSDSRKSAIVHACAMAAISTAIVSLSYLVESEAYPLWYNVVSYGLILPTAILGGLWRWRNLQRIHRVLNVSSPLPEVPRK